MQVTYSSEQWNFTTGQFEAKDLGIDSQGVPEVGLLEEDGFYKVCASVTTPSGETADCPCVILT